MFWLTQLVTTVTVLITSLAMLVATVPDAPNRGEVLSETATAFDINDELPDLNLIARYAAVAREEVGLMPLAVDEQLVRFAQERAEDMRTGNYYAHHNPESNSSFVDLLRESEYTYSYACENLNLQFNQDEAGFVASWLLSNDGHRECMLHSNITRVGYAVATVPLAADRGLTSYVVVAIHTAP
jgi:uncharacterized protein YkwD